MNYTFCIYCANLNNVTAHVFSSLQFKTFRFTNVFIFLDPSQFVANPPAVQHLLGSYNHVNVHLSSLLFHSYGFVTQT